MYGGRVSVCGGECVCEGGEYVREVSVCVGGCGGEVCVWG